MAVEKNPAALQERWHLPIRVSGWFLIFGIASLAALDLTVPPADLSPRWLPVGAPGAEAAVPQPSVRHLPMPEEVRGFYMTAQAAADPVRRRSLFAYAERNRLNAVVIDVKDGDGLLSFMPRSEALQAHAPEKATMLDLDGVLKEAGEAGLYRIARVFVFQDPMYVKRFPAEAVQKKGGGIWADHKGVTWVDPASKAAWAYNAELAKEIHARGFDEIQLDYIRFPSDGDLRTIAYPHHDVRRPKHEVIREFFSYMHRELEERAGIPVSLDLFGYVTWHLDYDLGIGQLLADALPYATAISAMTYPSHYGPGTLGFANPAEHPYEIIADSLRKANRLYARREAECAEAASGVRSATAPLLLPCGVPLAHHRPWIQAFDIGAVYTAERLRAQVQAIRDQGGRGFLLWNARNVYRDFDTATSTRR